MYGTIRDKRSCPQKPAYRVLLCINPPKRRLEEEEEEEEEEKEEDEEEEEEEGKQGLEKSSEA